MVPIGGGSIKSLLSDRWIVYTKSRKHYCYTENTFYLKQAVPAGYRRFFLYHIDSLSIFKRKKKEDDIQEVSSLISNWIERSK